jgi:hypothetical protein
MSVTCDVACDAEELARQAGNVGNRTSAGDEAVDLTAQALELGLTPVRAFVPAEQVRGKRSKGAERTARHRAKLAEDGMRPVQFVIDEDTAKCFREIVAIMERRKLPAEQALLAEFKEQHSAELRRTIESEYAKCLELFEELRELPWWKRWLAWLIGIRVVG